MMVTDRTLEDPRVTGWEKTCMIIGQFVLWIGMMGAIGFAIYCVLHTLAGM